MAESTRSEDGGSSDGRVSARELTLLARRTVQELTGYQAEAVTGLEWDGESWRVSVDVRELARIPNTTDVMATYVVQLDEQGQLLGYRRERRFIRGSDEG
jgi:Gas vesicle synthesis protein GvpO